MVRNAVIAAMCLLGPSSVAHAQPGVTAADLVGSWRFQSYEDRDDRGTVVRPYGAAPAGLLIYDATGHMAVQIMKTPPPDVVSDDWDKFTAPAKVALWDGYVAYFGRYEVDVARGVVIHLPEADLSRLYIGRREERRFALEGDRLTLSETWTQIGHTWNGVRVLTRQRGTAQAEFVGTWDLRAVTMRAADGKVSAIWGEHPVGRLTYDPHGRMSALLMPEARNQANRDVFPEAMAQELAAYYGTYVVSPDRHRRMSSRTVTRNPKRVSCALSQSRPAVLPMRAGERRWSGGTAMLVPLVV